MLSVLTMCSQCAHWVYGSLSPVNRVRWKYSNINPEVYNTQEGFLYMSRSYAEFGKCNYESEREVDMQSRNRGTKAKEQKGSYAKQENEYAKHEGGQRR